MAAALTLPLPTALLLMARPMRWLRVGLSAGRLAGGGGGRRGGGGGGGKGENTLGAGVWGWLWWMVVETKKGYRMLGPIWSVTSARSWYSVSDRLTTACLLTLYMPMLGAASSPAMLAVLTMWPRQAGSLLAAESTIGVNSRTPCIPPNRYTPST